MIWKSTFFLVCLALSGGEVAMAASPLACSKSDGHIAGPFVPTERVAMAIYDAVSKVIAPKNVVRFPRTVAEDAGDHWVVSQESLEPPPPAKEGEVQVQIGAGELVMSIDKCTGAISEASFAR